MSLLLYLKSKFCGSSALRLNTLGTAGVMLRERGVGRSRVGITAVAQGWAGWEAYLLAYLGQGGSRYLVIALLLTSCKPEGGVLTQRG